MAERDRALLRADQNIAKAARIVAQQRALLIDGEWTAEMASEAREFLKGFEEALRLMEEGRALIAAQRGGSD